MMVVFPHGTAGRILLSPCENPPGAEMKESSMAQISFEIMAEGGTLIVPPDVIEEIEQTFEYLAKNPGQNATATWADATEKNRWFRLARKYCAERPDGRLKIRQLPSKHLPENQARFTLTPDVAGG